MKYQDKAYVKTQILPIRTTLYQPVYGKQSVHNASICSEGICKDKVSWAHDNDMLMIINRQ